MSKKSTILTNLIAHMSLQTGTVGLRGLQYLHEINDFPCFFIHVVDEKRSHEGAGHKYAILNCLMRGYMETDTLDEVENYTRDLEESLQTFAPVNRHLVEDVRVMSVRTDEGLMAPHSIIDMDIEIVYEVTNV